MNNYKIVGILRCSNFAYKELVTGDNLNNTLGHYRTVQTAIIKSLVNRPAGLDKGGEITVDWYPAISDNAYGTQIIRQAHTGITYIHARSKIGLTSWGAWDTFVKNSDLEKSFYRIDLNTITYFCAGYCNSCTNTPTSAGNGFLEVYTYPGNAIYLQRYTSYGTGARFERRHMEGSTWTDWAAK